MSLKDPWKNLHKIPSLSEVHRSVPVQESWSWWKKMRVFFGPGFLIAVGYVDPGNWATDIEGGSKFGYALLSVVFLSSLMAMLLQHLSAKLGIATGLDLAQACKNSYSAPSSLFLWFMAEIAIIACDLAEVIGSAIALKLLFGIPVSIGVCITAIDILLIIYLQKFGFRYIEAFIIALMLIIGGCFWFEILFSHPHFADILSGFVPRQEIFKNPEMLYIAVGIVGATVMPHNLYLHSAIVQTRSYKQDSAGKREAIKYFTFDSTLALFYAFFINAAILILAAAVFYKSGHHEVIDIQGAYKLLTPLLNISLASTLFAVALLASGQSSTLTGTLTGQIIVEGFLNIRLKPWVRRFITRSLAIVPAAIAIIYYGESGLTKLLIFSQVVLSFQLSFALIPLVQFTGSKKLMGEFVNPAWIKCLGWASSIFIVCINLNLIYNYIKEAFFV